MVELEVRAVLDVARGLYWAMTAAKSPAAQRICLRISPGHLSTVRGSESARALTPTGRRGRF
jgi:hypothetical protein